jgi:crotonobetaine/carnitine-CoA ligase
MSGTIPDLVAAAADEAPDRTWLVADGIELTYAQARGRIEGVAARLAERGIGRGALVLATARNAVEYLLAWLGAMEVGAIYVAVDPRASDAELDGLVRQIDPVLIVSDGDLGERLGSRGRAVVDVDELCAEGAPADAGHRCGPRPEDPAVLIPTSGTTGRSKLVTQTHRAYVMAAEGFPWWLELGPDDRLMTSLPLFHINAPAYSVLGSAAARAGLVLLPRFSASTFLDSARRFGATEFNAIGAMLEILMRQPERPDDTDTPLRRCYTGPAPPRERHLEIERRFGLRIVCGYALSESPYGMVWARGTRPFGTLGSPRQHPTLGVVNEARVMRDGRRVPDGDVGELELRNPAVMTGYWGMPAETREVLRDDGWLRTGDLVTAGADGTYTFVGRQKEIIRRRGENVAPAEIEEALESHPAVVEAAVVGVPSALSEEEIKAFVVLADDTPVELAEVRERAAQRLTRFKLPRYVEAVAALPHTPTGRIAKHELPRERTPGEVDFEEGA